MLRPCSAEPRRTHAEAAAQRREMVALLLTLEGGGTSLCSPSKEYVSWLGVRRHTDTLPSCTQRRPSEYRHSCNSLLGILSTPAVGDGCPTTTLPSGAKRKAYCTGSTADMCRLQSQPAHARHMPPHLYSAIISKETVSCLKNASCLTAEVLLCGASGTRRHITSRAWRVEARRWGCCTQSHSISFR